MLPHHLILLYLQKLQIYLWSEFNRCNNERQLRELHPVLIQPILHQGVIIDPYLHSTVFTLCRGGSADYVSLCDKPYSCCKVLFNLKYYKLINYNWNFYYNQKDTKVISTKLSPKCCQYNARYKLYLWGVVLQCTWVLCCGVRFCMLRCTAHSYCNHYTPPHQTGRTTVDWTTTTKHTNEFPNPWGPGRIPGHAQGITNKTYWGPSYMLGHTFSLYIPHSL